MTTFISLKKPPKRHRILFWVLALAFLLEISGGCLDPGRWKTPNFAHPGTLEVQRHNMLLADPLPSVQTHGAQKDSLRPRDMSHPWSDLSVEMTQQEVFLKP
ncbi:MAG: hypothetical protein LBQ54_07430 [Planctomycetaceae bacterium]|jgi:hypothetical protein|nr:hypothetical protein [Planctomycetaceae bacterium]